MKQCLTCKIEYDDLFTFCRKCGGPLSQIDFVATEKEAAATRDCPSCQKANELHHVFCKYCGKSMTEEVINPAEIIDKTEEKIEEEKKQPVIDIKEKEEIEKPKHLEEVRTSQVEAIDAKAKDERKKSVYGKKAVFVLVTVLIIIGAYAVYHSKREMFNEPTPVPAPAPVEAPAPAPETSQIRITRAVIAVAVGSDNEPLGENTSFKEDTLTSGKLIYYVKYEDAIPNRTNFRAVWYRNGNIIGDGADYPLKSASGNFYNTLNYHFTSGDYEARLFVDGHEADRTSFYVSKPDLVSVKPPAAEPAQSAVKAHINILRGIMAEGVDSSGNPIGVNSNFSSGRKTLYCYISYTGAVTGSTIFEYRWFKDGSQINIGRNTVQYPSGNAWNQFTYNFEPSKKYQVTLYVDGRDEGSTYFSIIPSSYEQQNTYRGTPSQSLKRDGWKKSRESATYEDK